MAFCLSLDEQSVALGFVGIGDRAGSTTEKNKKHSRRKTTITTTADTERAESLSTSTTLPALPKPDDEMKVDAEETKQQAEDEVKLDDNKEVKLDEEEVLPAKHDDVDDDAELASTDRGLVMLAEENEAEEEKEVAPEPTAADDDVPQAGVGEEVIPPADEATSTAKAATLPGTSEAAAAVPKNKKANKNTKKARAKLVADNSVRHILYEKSLCSPPKEEEPGRFDPRLQSLCDER